MTDSRPARRIDATALLVLGMHRSGTSAIAGGLGVLGVPLGSGLLDAAPDNASGYWEHRKAVLLDERLLHALEMDWDDPRPLPSGWLDSDAATQGGSDIRALVTEDFGNAPLWALKDPRLCRLLPLWRRELAAIGVQAAALLVLRHPDEIAASLLARDALPPAVSHLLLIRHLLEAEAASREMPRAVTSYQRVLEDPAVAFGRIAVDLGLLWPQPPAKCSTQLDAFLDPDARHHAVGGREAVVLESPFRAAALELHALLDRGVPDAPTRSALDAFRDQFDAELESQQPWLDTLYSECRLRAMARARIAQRHSDEHAQLRQRVRDTEAAQERAEALSMQRLQELAQLTTRLRDADAALAQQAVEAQAQLAEAERLDRALGASHHAQRQAEELALQRMQELSVMDAQLATTQAALAGVEDLCVQRLHEIERLHEADAARAQQVIEAQAQQQAADANLARIRESYWWRAGAPLRALVRWWRRINDNGAGS